MAGPSVSPSVEESVERPSGVLVALPHSRKKRQRRVLSLVFVALLHSRCRLPLSANPTKHSTGSVFLSNCFGLSRYYYYYCLAANRINKPS